MRFSPRLLGAVGAGLLLVGGFVSFLKPAGPSIEPGPWLAAIGPDAPADVAVVSGTVEAAEPLKAPWSGREVVAYEVQVDQRKIEPGGPAGKKAALGPRLARIGADRQSVPFRLKTADGSIAVAGPIAAIDPGSDPFPEDSAVDVLETHLPLWALALPDAQPPVAIDGMATYEISGRSIPVGQEVSLVGRLSPDKQRLSRFGKGVLAYAGAKEALSQAATTRELQSPARQHVLWPLLLLGMMAIGAAVAWARWQTRA